MRAAPWLLLLSSLASAAVLPVRPAFPLAALQPPVTVPLSPAAPGLSRIAVLGDAGTGDERQLRVARAMTAERARAPYASVLVLGDNVYENGEPEKFDAMIRAPYAELFDGGVRFFPVMGNHDVRSGEGEAQRRYWGAPRWYKASIGDVDVFALDTNVLLTPEQQKADGFTIEHTELITKAQLEWLDAELGRSDARHKVVYGHHPLYLSANDPVKPKESARLRAVLEPLLVKHGVTLYLAGHKHHYERSVPVGGVTHVIAGAGGQLSKKPVTTPSGVSALVVMKHHFLTLESGPDGLRVRAHDKDGAVFDDVTLGRR